MRFIRAALVMVAGVSAPNILLAPLPSRAEAGGFLIAQAGGDEGKWGGVEHAPDRYRSGRPDASDDLRIRPTVPEASSASPGQITAGGDVLFGAQYVGFINDHDVIKVGRDVGKFAKIRLRVLENEIHIDEMRIVYENGEDQVLAFNTDIPKNSRTNWIDLSGDRFIKEIRFTYRSRPNFNGQARIEVFGQYAPGWLSPSGEGRKYNEGWVLLGAQTAGYIGFDKDVIPVGANEGGFRSIKIAARDRAITLKEIKVVYVGGEEVTIPVRSKIEAGSAFGPIELKGRQRQAIDRIETKVRSRLLDSTAMGKGAAIVEIWAQHY